MTARVTFVPFGVIGLCTKCGFLSGSVDHNKYGPPGSGGNFDIDARIVDRGAVLVDADQLCLRLKALQMDESTLGVRN